MRIFVASAKRIRASSLGRWWRCSFCRRRWRRRCRCTITRRERDGHATGLTSVVSGIEVHATVVARLAGEEAWCAIEGQSAMSSDGRARLWCSTLITLNMRGRRRKNTAFACRVGIDALLSGGEALVNAFLAIRPGGSQPLILFLYQANLLPADSQGLQGHHLQSDQSS